MRVFAQISGLRDSAKTRQRIDEVLELVDLTRQAKDACRKYSLGMKQRLAIGMALLTDPELVLLDEPTNGLDPMGVHEIRQMILRLAANGKTVILSSHLLYEVQQVCNRVAILQKGHIVMQGEVSNLLRQSERLLVRMNTASEAQAAQAILRSTHLDWLAHIEQQNESLEIAAPASYEQLFSPQARVASIDPGRSDYLSTLWRLTSMELYKLRRRTYSRVILWILLGCIALFVILTGIAAHTDAVTPAANMVRQCSARITTHCTTQHYSSVQLAQLRESVLHTDADVLGFPGSLHSVMQSLSYNLIAMPGLLLLAPLMGTQYTLGTIRLLFTRGPTRVQCILGKVFASLIYVVGVLLLLTLTYIVVGMLVYPLTGVPYSYLFGPFHDARFGGMFGNDLWLVVIVILYWYAFGVLGELEVLTQIAHGRTNHEIAVELVIGEQTVKTHVSTILSKLHLADRTQAAVYALQRRLVRLDEALEQEQ